MTALKKDRGKNSAMASTFAPVPPPRSTQTAPPAGWAVRRRAARAASIGRRPCRNRARKWSSVGEWKEVENELETSTSRDCVASLAGRTKKGWRETRPVPLFFGAQEKAYWPGRPRNDSPRLPPLQAPPPLCPLCQCESALTLCGLRFVEGRQPRFVGVALWGEKGVSARRAPFHEMGCPSRPPPLLSPFACGTTWTSSTAHPVAGLPKRTAWRRRRPLRRQSHRTTSPSRRSRARGRACHFSAAPWLPG